MARFALEVWSKSHLDSLEQVSFLCHPTCSWWSVGGHVCRCARFDNIRCSLSKLALPTTEMIKECAQRTVSLHIPTGSTTSQDELTIQQLVDRLVYPRHRVQEMLVSDYPDSVRNPVSIISFYS